MKTELECLPCFFRQVRFALGSAGVNGDLGRAIMRKGEAIVERASFARNAVIDVFELCIK